jgi:uncharacterized protein
MVALFLIGLAGFGAQLVDGSLGMGYGVTSATLLIAIGLTPVMASASVNMAQIGTTAVSGFSHGKLGNVDKVVFRRIAIPGAIGAFLGAMFLTQLSTNFARPWASTILLLLGVYVLVRYLRQKQMTLRKGRPRTQFLIPLGLAGGFINSTGGGGWGPVSTPALLATGRMAPSRVIGTVNAAEFAVTVSATVGFLVAIGLAAVDFAILLPLMIGGMIAAPFAAWVASRLPMRIMGVAVGGMIITTNTLTLTNTFAVPAPAQIALLTSVIVVWFGLVALVIAQHRARKATTVSL